MSHDLGMNATRRRLLLALAALPGAPLAQAVAPGADPISPTRALVFPRDFGAHPGARTEWWYATGWLGDLGSEGPAPRFGFQVTFFRSRTDVPATHPSRFAASQLIFAHAAVTDLGAGRQRHDQRIARAGFGLAGADAADTRVKLRDWTFTREGPAERSRYTARLRSETAGFTLDLQLDTTQPLLRQGAQGYSRKGPHPEQASHYYSQPQLQASGTVTLDGQPRGPLQGRAWLDHEWSESVLDRQAVGWDWIGMNLLDGSALTAFRLRRADGSAVYAGGSMRAAGVAEARAFGPDEVRFVPGRSWASTTSRAVYPVEWEVATPAGTWRVRALLDAQELDSRGNTGGVYWEGLSELLDAGGKRVGLGYLEMTGYSGKLAM